jgi:radical SAM protein with 4Fe4S-binding SPASM domain
MQLFNVIEIETVNLCTRRCWHCKFGQERKDGPVKWLSNELLEKIADNLKELNFRGRISPFGINEPLMDRRMPDIVRLFRSSCPDSMITLASNGDLLTPEIYRNLLDAGLDGLGLSIYDKESFKKLKIYWKDPKVRLMDGRHEPFWENRGGQIKKGKFAPKIDKICLRPFHSIVIKPNGDVVLCCSDMYGDVVMGSIAENRLEEIWNSEKFRRYRSRLAVHTRKGLLLCETCSYEGGFNAFDFPFHIPSKSPLHISLKEIFRRMNSFFPENYLYYSLKMIRTLIENKQNLKSKKLL